MPIENHNKIINKTAKDILSPHGVFQKGQSRLWIDDNGWVLTLVEFQPSGAKGSYLNVGLSFLWEDSAGFAFHFSSDNSSRTFFNNGKQFINYINDVQFEEEMNFLAQVALDRVFYYRQYKDLHYAKKCLSEVTFYKAWLSWHKLMLRLLIDDKDAEKYYVDFESELDLNEKLSDKHRQENKERVKKFRENLGENSPRNAIISTIIYQRDYLRGKGMKKLSTDIGIDRINT